MRELIHSLHAAAEKAEELEGKGYQVTVRLIDTGFRVQVSRNFHTSRRLVTFEDLLVPNDNVLVKVMQNAAEHCPKLSFEEA